VQSKVSNYGERLSNRRKNMCSTTEQVLPRLKTVIDRTAAQRRTTGR